MLILTLSFLDKPVDKGSVIISRPHYISPEFIQAEALRRQGRYKEAEDLILGNGKVIDNEEMRILGELKDKIYAQRRNPFQPPSTPRPLWETSDGMMTSSGLDEKYHDVVKDPHSDTLFAAVIKGTDSIIVYKGIIDWTTPTITWSRWVGWGYPTGGPLLDPSIAVSANYVFVGFSKYYSSTDIDPRILKINRSTSSTYLYYISSSLDYERSTVITTDYEEYVATTYVYFAYWNDNKDSVMFARIDNPDTTTFTSYNGIAYSFGSSTNVQRLSIDYFFSGGSKLYIAYTSADTVLLADGSPFGSSWTERVSTFRRGYFPHIKGYRGGPYLAVVYSYPWSSTDYDCDLQYSTDAGATFTQYSCSASTDDELWPTVAFAADSVWVAMLRGDKETTVDSLTDTLYVMVAKHSLSGSSWLSRDSINDPAYKYGTLITWHPVIVGPEDTVSTKQFLHVSWARRFGITSDFDIRYDYNFFSTPTSIAEKVKPVDITKVYSAKGGIYISGKGEYKVYTASGRIVSSGRIYGSKLLNLPKGAYIVELNKKFRTVVVR